MERLKKVIEKIDALNKQDPNQESVHGFFYPKEFLYSQRLTDWVLRLEPNASEELKIAARGQHVKRWEIKRDTYPMDRGGYLRWREDLKKFHSQIVGEIMSLEGYPAEVVDSVKNVMLKKNLKILLRRVEYLLHGRFLVWALCQPIIRKALVCLACTGIMVRMF